MNTKQSREPGAPRPHMLPSVRNTATRLVSLGAHVAGSLLAAVCNWALVESISDGDHHERLSGMYQNTRSGS